MVIAHYSQVKLQAHLSDADGVYHTTEDTTVFHPGCAPSAEQLQILLNQINQTRHEVIDT